MSAFRVWTQEDGTKVWSEYWHQVHPASARDATLKEAELMEKVVWQNDTFEDREKLKALLQKE